MSITLLIAAGVIAGASVKRSIDLHRLREKNRHWLVSSTALAAPALGVDSKGETLFIVLDRLEQIADFEPIYARRLNASGILTYGQMAELSPAALQSIVAPNGPFNLPMEQWLAQAGRLAGEAEKL